MNDQRGAYLRFSTGEYYFHEEQAILELLQDDVLFANERAYVDFDGSTDQVTIVLFVSCNDIFAWGSADADDIGRDELEDLYVMHAQDERWGSAKWSCKKRNEQPQRPVRKLMEENGSWEAWMEDLDPNYYDARSAELAAARRAEAEHVKGEEAK